MVYEVIWKVSIFRVICIYKLLYIFFKLLNIKKGYFYFYVVYNENNF